ncbi:MAG TPA: pseudouridine synthase [Solirubrobacteraceae bacterium]|jgi:23S rRNA pseudouridine2605 synthase
MRLAKYLASAGVASRRASEEIVRAGRVTIDGTAVTDPARDVTAEDHVLLDGHEVQPEPERVVYAVNKPRGIVSTAKDTHGRKTVVSLVPEASARLYPVGRLDADSTGLILLTNDGELAHRLTHPSFEVPKTYRATVRNPPVSDQAIDALKAGIDLDDGKTAPAKVRRLARDTLEITIHEGRKRQVKRMCEAVGHRVKSLERIAFGSLGLGELKSGRHRRLTDAELRALANAGGAARRSGSASSRAHGRRPRA